MYYRGSGPWGAGKGSNLVAAEFDSNTYQLVQMINAKAAQGVGIAAFNVVGDELYVTLTDHSILGPYPLPVATITFVGAWQPSHQYYTNQIFTANGNTYIVLANHTSAATFDPGANDGAGHSYYGLLLSNAANALPTGGAVGMVLEKATTTDFSVVWAWPTLAGLHDVLPSPAPDSGDLVYWTGSAFSYIDPATLNTAPQALRSLSDVLPSPAPSNGEAVIWSAAAHAFTYGVPGGGGGGTLASLSDVFLGTLHQGDVLTYSLVNGDWVNLQPQPYQSWTTSTKTLALADTSNWIDCQGSAQTLTIPANATVAFPTGATVWLKQFESATTPVTVVGASGVTLVPPPGRLAKARATGSVIKVTQYQTDRWELDGDLAYDITAGGNPLNGASTATQTISPTTAYDVNVFPVTVTVAQNYAVSPAPAGVRITFVITSSGTTSCTITFGAGFKSQGTLATGTVTGKVFTVSFIGDGTNFNEISRTTAM